MGQIQNSVLNALSSVQQMAQMYKLTDAYIKQQTQKSANAARIAAEEEAKQKYEDLKNEYEKKQTVEEIQAKIHAEPFSKEENDAYKKEYNKFYDNTYKDDKSRKDALTKEKGDITKLIRAYPGNLNDLEYKNLVRKRQWLDNEDFDYLFKSRSGGGKAKAQKSPQEQADTNENIEKAKNMAKGGNK